MDFALDIAAARENVTISGKALKKIDTSLDTLVLTITNIRGYSTGDLPGEVTQQKIQEALFNEAYNEGRIIFKTVVGTQRLYKLRERNGIGAGEEDIEEIVRGMQPIDEREYPIFYDADPRRELNRLMTVAATYEAIFRSLSNDAMSIYTSSSRLVSDQSNKSEVFSLLASAVLQMKTAVTDYKRLIFQGPSPHEENFSVANTVQTAADIARLMYESGQYRINLKVDEIPNGARMKGSPFELMQALLNVLRAKQYVLRNTKDAEVRIRYESRGTDYAAIVVKDNGPQIPHSEPSLIIELARKKASIEHWPGDISVARDYVERYGGKFTVRNPPSMVGVEMDMTFPL